MALKSNREGLRKESVDYLGNLIIDEKLKQNIINIIPKFRVISFDNLALEQLDIKKQISNNQWNNIYMGDDGEFTFYIDLVKGTYAKNSISCEEYPINGMTIRAMFEDIKTKSVGF